MSGIYAAPMDFPNRRELVRIYYPADCSARFLPVLTIQSRTYRIMDICEKGIRFANPDNDRMEVDIVSATLKFPDNIVIPIIGRVIRRSFKQIALKLDQGIPYRRIMNEQLRLRKLETGGMIYY